MFDKLVESDTTGAEFRNRSRYFMVSSVVVGILFLSAVVYSLYAAEIGLGNGNFEIAELISPVANEAPEPERLQQRSPANQSSSTPRNIDSNMASVDEPTIAPTSVSTVQNTQPSRGTQRFNPLSPESFGYGSSGNPGSRETTGSSSAVPESDLDEPNTRISEPPPAIKKPSTILRTSKVLNGEAISLPKPAFPRPAIILNLEGAVKVQVTIDEAGNVISAKAADGHPFFRQVAEQAAKNAKFRPTLLNGVPVKVTGVIVYHFKRN